MREQVGTIFPSTNGLDNVEFFKRLINAAVITHWEKTEISGYACL